MKILQITHKFPPGFAGGSGNSAFILSKELKRMGHNIRIISFDGAKTHGEREKYQGLNIVRFRVKKNINKNDFPKLTQYIKNIIQNFNPDVVHIHSIWTVGLSPLKALENFQGKIIMKLPDYVMICARGTMLKKNKSVCTNPGYYHCISCVPFKRFIRSIYTREYFFKAAKNIQLLAPSRYMQSMFLKANPRLNVKYFPNFYSPVFKDINKLDKNLLKDKYNLTGKKVILFSGRIIETKGYQYLLQAMQYIKDKKTILIMAGNNIDGDKLLKFINKFKVKNKVRYLGNFPLHKLPEIYRISDILVVPSVWPDNSPNVIYEALIASIPIIGSNIGGIPDLIVDNKNGFLVPPNNVPILAEKINLLLNDNKLLDKLKKESLRRSANYQSSRLIKKLVNQYYK